MNRDEDEWEQTYSEMKENELWKIHNNIIYFI